MRDRVAHASVLQFLDAGDHEAHFAGRELRARAGLRREDAHLFAEVVRARRHEGDLVLGFERAVHDAHEHDDAHVVVEPRVDDEGLQGLRGASLRGRHVAHDALENVVDPHAGLGRAWNGVGRVDPDHVLDFFGRGFGVGASQVHLVENRDHFDAEVDRRVAVGDRLRFDALRRVDDEKRPFAGGERTALEFVRLTVLGLVLERRGLRLDRDAAFALEVHAVEDLGAHFTVGEPAAALNQAVGERRFAVVDVGDDGKIADILHRHESVERDGGRGEKGSTRRRERNRPKSPRARTGRLGHGARPGFAL